ncbi:extracellular solute-binding protein [Calidifontibacter sp. DB0510]|uniref:Extracellular solute-binding protein n=1 Tax=Metallococcus carri TaxID=1656884 RepID=A0A967B3U0_9MICO|nr:extracellular solute-binding protein [Metallococcus carri]NHN56855.1 extracellular solute-binding protein [Metallococcus carri]NOP37768.1 extracellular solute-binding protein [Calidifontibacter sp. DB2511S]
MPRKPVLLTGALALVLTLTACGAGPADETGDDGAELVTEVTEETTVTMWHTLTGHHQEALEAQIAQFNAEHENMRIEAQAQPLTDFDSKVQQAVRNGTGPNMISGYPNIASSYIDDGFLVDFTPYVEDEEIGIPDFEDKIMPGVYAEASQWDDRLYLFPQARTGEVLFYNKTMYDQLGLDVPQTWTELAENSRAITEETGKPAFGFDSVVDGVLLQVMQRGGSLVDPESMTSTINSDTTTAVFEDLQSLYEDGVYRLVGEDQYFSNPFGAEAVYSYIGSSAGFEFVADAVGDKFEVGVAPVPQEGGTPYVNSWGGFGMVFDTTPEENLVAYTYYKWLTMTPEVAAQSSIDYGSVPASLEAQQTPEFVQFMEENPVMGALAESLENVGYIPAVTGSETARSSLDRAAQQILLGESDIATALEAAETETNRAMAE